MTPAAIGIDFGTTNSVVALAGDGDFLMNGQELATAVQYGADLLVLVIDTQDPRYTSASTIGGRAYAIDEETAIAVVDGVVEVVSEGEWLAFG